MRNININATGQKIKERMDETDVTVKELASALSVTVQAVHKYRAGAALPSVLHMAVIASTLDTRVEDLVVMIQTI